MPYLFFALIATAVGYGITREEFKSKSDKPETKPETKPDGSAFSKDDLRRLDELKEILLGLSKNDKN